MVGRRIHGADTVSPGGETGGDRRLEQTITISIIVDSLEEGKEGWVRRSGGSNVTSKVLDGDVTVTDNIAVRSQFLGCSVVSGQGVRE